MQPANRARGNIAVDSRGNINVVWDDFTPGNSQIFFSRSTDGGVTFSTPKNLSNLSEIFFSRSTDGGVTFSIPKNLSNNAGFSGSSRIAVDSGGNINVVWEDNTPGNLDIFFSRSIDGGLTFFTPKN